MKNKAQMNGMGMIVITAITLLVGVILFQVIAQQVGSSTTQVLINSTLTITNDTISVGYIDYRAISDVIIVNNSDNALIDTANYTVTNNVINPTNQQLATSIVINPDYLHTLREWRISGTAQPTTYIADSGARSIAGIIAIMFALAIVVVALVPSLRSEIMNLMK